MKEVEAYAGDHISLACKRLAAEAPAFMTFNNIRIEACPGDTAGDLEAKYQGASEERARAYEAERKRFNATPEGQRKLAEAKRAKDEESRRQAEAIAAIEAAGTRQKYLWLETMDEISGFGGGYENACRTMLYAGLRLLDANGGQFDSDATDRELVTVEPGCTGAMHGTCMGAVRFISMHGWHEYVRRTTRRERSGATA
jgi:hypothetical protein